MKFKKLILLFLSIILILNFVNCTKQDSTNDNGKLALETKVPEIHSDSQAIVSSEGDSESSSEHPKINGREIIDCNNTAVSLNEFSYRQTSIALNPYKCVLKNPNGITGSKSLSNKLSTTRGSPLSIEKCDQKCFDKEYTCSEIEIKEDMGYGSYSIMIKGGGDSNTQIYISLETEGGDSGKDYSNIFFKISGNTSVAEVGITDGGTPTSAKIQLDRGFENSYSNYTILYTQYAVIFYQNGKELKNFGVQYMQISVIKPPIIFRVLYSILNYNSIKPSGYPSTIYVENFSYHPGPCLDDEEYEGYFIPKPYYDYYIGNCTLKDSMIIYNGSLMDADWEINGQSSFSVNNTEVKRVDYSISCAFNSGVNYLRFKTKKLFPVTKHHYLSFWVNGGTRGGQTLWVILTLGNHKISTVNLNDYIIGGIKKKQWVKVIIPMSKFQLHEDDKVQLIDGFMIQPTNNQYMDRVYFDFITFTNGSRCLSSLNTLSIYKNGRLENTGEEQDSFSTVYSKGNYDLKSVYFGKGKNTTIQYEIQGDTQLQINFVNNTLETETYDTITFKFYYHPDRDYVNSDAAYANIQTPMRVEVCLLTETGVETYTCLDLSSYVGGLFPSEKWFTLSIPWIDLSCDVIDGAKIGGLLIKTPSDMNMETHQGTLYFQTIELHHFRLPEKEHLEGSFAIKSLSLFNHSLLLFILIISIIILL